MTYTLKIGSTIEVPITFSLRDGGKDVPFSFSLSVKRLDAAEIKALGERFASGDYGDREFLADHVTDWRGQRLVMDEGQPAPFNAESLDMMCSVAGVQFLLAKHTLEAIMAGAKSADAEKAKN